jgi:dTDP-glucose pyrophosphorylase
VLVQGALPNLPLVTQETSIRDTMSVIDRCGKGIALVVDDQKRLVTTITDGDIRRAILAGIDLDHPVIRSRKAPAGNDQVQAVTAPQGTADAELINLMQIAGVRQIPLLDEEGKVCDLAVLHKLLKQTELPVAGVIMAGGYGKRLMPLTESVPKPMLPVNGRPLLERMLDKLRIAGIQSVSVTTHYLSDTIVDHFKDGSDFGIQLNYVKETEPRGTAGALARVPPGKDPLLVMNGDILTGIDIRAMLDFHNEHDAHLTVGVRQYDIEVPFGVVETNGVKVTRITEKPVLRHFINAGIYMINRDVCRLVPTDRYFDMPDLIAAAVQAGQTVISFPIREYWLDIGRIDQYQRADADVAEGII